MVATVPRRVSQRKAGASARKPDLSGLAGRGTRRALGGAAAIPSGRATPADSAQGLTAAEIVAIQKALLEGRFEPVFEAAPMTLIATIKSRVPALVVQRIASSMNVPKERIFATVGLARATANRKIRKRQKLSEDDSARVLGIARLVGQVDAIVRRSGNPDGFDAARWTASWLERPLPALGGRAPAELMDTIEGQKLVANLLARLESGAYA